MLPRRFLPARQSAGGPAGELVHPLDHPALVAEAGGGQLLGILPLYSIPGQFWLRAVEFARHGLKPVASPCPQWLT
jgi:hypothetical protein